MERFPEIKLGLIRFLARHADFTCDNGPEEF